MKKIIKLLLPAILLFSIFFTPISPSVSNTTHITTQKNEAQAFVGAAFRILVNVLKGTTKKTKVTKNTKYSKNNFVLPPKDPVIRTHKGKKQVQTMYNNGDTKWIPINNQKYKNKTFTNKNNKKIKYDKNGFPKFPRKFQMTLKNTSLKEKRQVHDSEANKALKKAYEKNPKKFNSKFTPEEINQIKKGKKPKSYTWHHHQKRGVMQLVHKSYHTKDTSHTGGIAIWGRN